jgi:hypothetical protein
MALAVLRPYQDSGTIRAIRQSARVCDPPLNGIRRDLLVEAMNLAVWLPVLFVLGLALLGLMFAFVFACEKV